jgi:hypothetical protein
MRASALTLAALLAACGSPRINNDGGIDPHGDDAGTTSDCRADSDCGAAQVCVNCGGVGQCTPGCRDRAQCGVNEICQLGTVCERCPCPPGWCVIDPCRDEDMDGFVPTTDPFVTCPGKQKGDCADRNKDVRPGAAELCTNYLDDNCDDLRDERDPSCVCPAGQAKCGSSWECGIGTAQCQKGCCQACYDRGQPPNCFSFGYCAQPYGINPYSGCSYGWLCDACSGCPMTVSQVCAVNGSTYDNSCLLQLRHTRELHTGACLPGEGVHCRAPGQPGLDGGCGSSDTMYCRDACPMGTSCATGVCTKKGACLIDSDCPAGLATALEPCDAGTPAFSCVNNACQSVCR